jgi:hypothetical protein
MRHASLVIRPSTALVATLTLAGSLGIGSSAVATPRGGANIVTLTFGEELEDGHAELAGSLEVQLGDYPGDPSLAIVEATLGGKTYTLSYVIEDQAFLLHGKFGSIEDLKATLHGTIVIMITGASNSISSFYFNAQGLTSDDIYSLPRNLTPGPQSVVQGDEACTWNPPLRGPANPFMLACGRDDLVSDNLPPGTTSWNPGVCMGAGFHTVAVEYVALTATALFTPMTVVSGSIVWSNYDFMPPGYPTAGPAIGTVSSTAHGFFSKGSACVLVGDVDGDGSVTAADLSLLLAAWGSPGATDLDGDGDTGAADLSLLLANWG